MSGDASPPGVGAVLAQVMEDGSERLVAFASRSLSVVKKNAQVEKEGLAIVFTVKKFHDYLQVGSLPFVLITRRSSTFSVR